MKILVLPSWYIPTNGGYFFKEQSLALSREGHDVSVLAVNEYGLKMIGRLPKPTALFKIVEMEEDGLKTIRYDYIRIPKADILSLKMRQFITEKAFKYYFDRYGRPDLIHVHSVIWGGYIAAILKEKYGIPYVITEHRGRFVNNKFVDPNQLRDEYSPYIRKGLRNADKIITVNSALNQKLALYDETILERLIVIPNMVDTKFFVPAKNIPSTGEFIYFCLAHLIYLKGFDVAIKAFKKVLEIHENCKLVIGGEGSERSNLERLAIDLEIQDKVEFLGRLNRTMVREQMQKSHVFVLPTRYEAFGVVYIEALSCGIPVVGTRAGGPESIINDTNGLIVDPDNVSQLVDAMISMINNYESYNSVQIREEAVKIYSIEVVAKSILREFEIVLDN